MCAVHGNTWLDMNRKRRCVTKLPAKKRKILVDQVIKQSYPGIEAEVLHRMNTGTVLKPDLGSNTSISISNTNTNTQQEPNTNTNTNTARYICI